MDISLWKLFQILQRDNDDEPTTHKIGFSNKLGTQSICLK